MNEPSTSSNYLVQLHSYALTATSGASGAILSRMVADTLSTLQGNSTRTFRVLICGVIGEIPVAEVTRMIFTRELAKLRSGPIEAVIYEDGHPHALFTYLELNPFDLVIVLNALVFGRVTNLVFSPAQLLTELYERTHKPIIAMSSGWRNGQKDELRSSGAFACMDVPFTSQQVYDVCLDLLGKNGFIHEHPKHPTCSL